MLVAIDIDGSIDAAPAEFASMLSAIKAAGHTVVVLTGSSDTQVDENDWQEKSNYLNALGCGACWDELVVIGHGGGDVADDKAQWCADNGVDVLIDNDKGNAAAATAAGVPLVLVPWASRV